MKAINVIKMFKNAKMLGRHGDVVIIQHNAKLETEKDMDGIVAEGEVTGHAHRVLTDAKVERVKGEIDQMIIRALKPTKISHEEHKDGALSEGKYIAGVQRQFNPTGWARVQD